MTNLENPSMKGDEKSTPRHGESAPNGEPTPRHGERGESAPKHGEPTPRHGEQGQKPAPKHGETTTPEEVKSV